VSYAVIGAQCRRSSQCIEYLSACHEFFNSPDYQINRQKLAAVLAAERLYIQLATEYGQKLVDTIQRAQVLERELKERGDVGV
jgi:hypothetical protein